MKHKIESIPALRVTAIGYDPVNNRNMPFTKICHKASIAAKHYASTRTHFWHVTRPKKNRSDYNLYLDKLERRVLKVFQKYLP